MVNDITDEVKAAAFFFFFDRGVNRWPLADGSDKMQAEVRLVQRIGDADAALHESRMEVRGVIRASSFV